MADSDINVSLHLVVPFISMVSADIIKKSLFVRLLLFLLTFKAEVSHF
jgi:hypothetical protein